MISPIIETDYTDYRNGLPGLFSVQENIINKVNFLKSKKSLINLCNPLNNRCNPIQSELRIFREPRERYHIPDIAHPGNKKH